jgi:hypothetical protein
MVGHRATKVAIGACLSCVIDEQRIRMDDPYRGVFFEYRYLPRERTTQQDVIRIQNGNVLSSCSTERVCIVSGWPEVLVRRCGSYSFIGERSNNFQRVVGRAVIGYEQFEVFEILSKDAADCVRYIPLRVVGQRNDRN